MILAQAFLAHWNFPLKTLYHLHESASWLRLAEALSTRAGCYLFYCVLAFVTHPHSSILMQEPRSNPGCSDVPTPFWRTAVFPVCHGFTTCSVVWTHGGVAQPLPVGSLHACALLGISDPVHIAVACSGLGSLGYSCMQHVTRLLACCYLHRRNQEATKEGFCLLLCSCLFDPAPVRFCCISIHIYSVSYTYIFHNRFRYRLSHFRSRFRLKYGNENGRDSFPLVPVGFHPYPWPFPSLASPPPSSIPLCDCGVSTWYKLVMWSC